MDTFTVLRRVFAEDPTFTILCRFWRLNFYHFTIPPKISLRRRALRSTAPHLAARATPTHLSLTLPFTSSCCCSPPHTHCPRGPVRWTMRSRARRCRHCPHALIYVLVSLCGRPRQRRRLPFYAVCVPRHTFTVLRQNQLTFTEPSPYALRAA